MRWILLLGLFTTSAWAEPFHIIVDPGHGGVDAGATRAGVREADVVLQVSKKLAALLDKDKRFKVTLTRKNNKTFGLKERAELANKLQADLFVSIHANASRDKRANGAEFYLQNHLKASDEAEFLAAREEEADSSREIKQQIIDMGDFNTDSNEVLTILDDLVRTHRIVQSDKLATSLAADWRPNYRVKRNAIRQAPFYLVSNVHMPSVLVELGYLSNKREAKKLTSTKHQKTMARNIYKGLIRYKESLDK